MKIAVAGMGYVGLSLAVLLSQNNDVVIVDVDEQKVKSLNNWITPSWRVRSTALERANV